MRVLALAVVVTILGASTALADDAAGWIERSHDAVYDSSQTVSCQTPAGQVDGVFSVAGTGVAVQAGQGSDPRVFGVNGVFASTDTPSDAIGVPTEDRAGIGIRYTSSEIAAERFEGRRTKYFNLLRDDIVRATVGFDLATGALIAMTTFNADGSVYCSIQTTSFTQPLGLVEITDPVGSEPTQRLEPVDADPAVAPASVAGFARLDTYRWRETGAASFYSDGFFSFTLLSSPQTFALDDTDASDVELAGGIYRRLFEPGRATYVWESEMGGMSIVGDLPIDIQESVLSELAPADRPGLLTRIWRRLFR